MRTCRARSVHLLGGLRLPSLSSTRRDQYILPWLFSIRCLGPASSREPVFPSYGEQPLILRGDSLPRLPHVDGSSAGTRVPSSWAPLEAPTIRRSTYADDC